MRKGLEREIIAAHKNVAINLISIKFNVKPTKWIVKYCVYTTNLNA